MRSPTRDALPSHVSMLFEAIEIALTERVRAEANRRAERRLVCSLYLCGPRRRDCMTCLSAALPMTSSSAYRICGAQSAEQLTHGLIRRRAEVDPVEPPLDRRLASRRVDDLSERPDLLRSLLVKCFAVVVVR
eukprot:137153-Prymnesium_polylepis.1